MRIQEHLSSALDRRDQEPNKLLASRIVAGEFHINELVDFLRTEPKRQFQQDATLVMAYVAELHPKLVAPYGDFLIRQLDSKINRVVWGSMIALSHLVKIIPEILFHSLPQILHAMESGTVVSRDHGFKILIGLYAQEEYREQVKPLISEQIQIAPDNQLGQYSERWVEVIQADHSDLLITILEDRKMELTNTSHLKRLEKNLRKLAKI